jgi:hypothetical protein
MRFAILLGSGEWRGQEQHQTDYYSKEVTGLNFMVLQIIAGLSPSSIKCPVETGSIPMTLAFRTAVVANDLDVVQ